QCFIEAGRFQEGPAQGQTAGEGALLTSAQRRKVGRTLLRNVQPLAVGIDGCIGLSLLVQSTSEATVVIGELFAVGRHVREMDNQPLLQRQRLTKLGFRVYRLL